MNRLPRYKVNERVINKRSGRVARVLSQTAPLELEPIFTNVIWKQDGRNVRASWKTRNTERFLAVATKGRSRGTH